MKNLVDIEKERELLIEVMKKHIPDGVNTIPYSDYQQTSDKCACSYEIVNTTKHLRRKDANKR